MSFVSWLARIPRATAAIFGLVKVDGTTITATAGVIAAAADASKEKMYELHQSDPKTFTVDKLAADYGLRYQRVLAILTLKKARALDAASATRRLAC